MKDVATPVPQNEVRAVIKKSLENAALVNYERLSEEARIEGEYRPKKLREIELNYHFSKKIHELFKTLSKHEFLNFLRPWQQMSS